MNNIVKLASILCKALSEAQTKDTPKPVIEIKKEQLIELIKVEAIDRQFMISLAQEVSKRNAYLTSVQNAEDLGDSSGYCYYLAFKTNPFYTKAKQLQTASLKRMLEETEVSLEAILDLKKLRLTPRVLATTTCASIGHSSIVKADAKEKSVLRCVRCNAKVKAGQLLGKERDLTSNWQDVVNVDEATLFTIADQVSTLDDYSMNLFNEIKAYKPAVFVETPVKVKKTKKQDKKSTKTENAKAKADVKTKADAKVKSEKPKKGESK